MIFKTKQKSSELANIHQIIF